MYIGKMFSADFGESTIEFKIEGDFTLKAGKYFILSEEEYTALNKVESSQDVKEYMTKENWVGWLKKRIPLNHGTYLFWLKQALDGYADDKVEKESIKTHAKYGRIIGECIGSLYGIKSGIELNLAKQKTIEKIEKLAFQLEKHFEKLNK